MKQNQVWTIFLRYERKWKSVVTCLRQRFVFPFILSRIWTCLVSLGGFCLFLPVTDSNTGSANCVCWWNFELLRLDYFNIHDGADAYTCACLSAATICSDVQLSLEHSQPCTVEAMKGFKLKYSRVRSFRALLYVLKTNASILKKTHIALWTKLHSFN
jgi:hypothetical protein